MYMLAGTYTAKGSKGVYVYKLNTETGASKYISEVAVEDPSYLAISKMVIMYIRLLKRRSAEF